MTLTQMAARLRKASAEMNTLAALTNDDDYPSYMIPAFLINFIFDETMFPKLLRAGAKEGKKLSDR
jgi:hypothetical protein